jgi:putative oligomerization/nucleic acid binding protein
MGFFKDARKGMKDAKELGDYHGGMPSMRGAFKDISALADDRGEGEILKNGIPAKGVVKGFAEPVPGDRFAMHIPIEVHPREGEPYVVDHVFSSARMKAAVSVGMEIPIKIHPNDPNKIAVQWDAQKASIAAAGGDMAAVQQGFQNTYSGAADAAMRQAMANQQAGAGAAPAAKQDPAERLKKLGELKDSGVLSDEEFEAKKAEILKEL